MSAPLAVTDMRLALDCKPIATDSSETRAGVSIGYALTDRGVDDAARLAGCPALSFDNGLVVIEVGDGCGCARLAVQRLGLEVIAGVHCCGVKAARLVYMRNYGGDWSFPGAGGLTRGVLEDIKRQAPLASVVVAVYALPAREDDGHPAPCRGGAAAQGAQLQAGIARYAAVFDLAVEVRAVFRDHPFLEIFHSSLDTSVRDLHVVSEAVAQTPYIVDAGGMSRATSVRLFWTSFLATASPTREVTSTETGHARSVFRP